MVSSLAACGGTWLGAGELEVIGAPEGAGKGGCGRGGALAGAHALAPRNRIASVRISSLQAKANALRRRHSRDRAVTKGCEVEAISEVTGLRSAHSRGASALRKRPDQARRKIRPANAPEDSGQRLAIVSSVGANVSRISSDRSWIPAPLSTARPTAQADADGGRKEAASRSISLTSADASPIGVDRARAPEQRMHRR
jgi:hypothetical protein